MSDIRQYLTEQAQAKTGLGTSVLVGYAAQAVLGLAAVVLFFVAVFFVCSESLGFGATKTSIGMLLAVGVLLVGAILWTNSAKRRTIEEAERALETSASGLNSPFVQAGLQLGRAVGWKRIIPAAFALFAAGGVAAEWGRRQSNHRKDQ